MAEIEIGLGAIVGHERLRRADTATSVPDRVEIGVEFSETDLVPACLQQRTKCR